MGAYLEAVPELTVVIEGNAAPFDSAKERYSMGLRRAKAVREHLLEHFNIAARRVRTTSTGSSRSSGIVRGAGNEAYTEFRCARILVDADSLAAAQHRLSAERKTEAADETDTTGEADETAEAAAAGGAADEENAADTAEAEIADAADEKTNDTGTAEADGETQENQIDNNTGETQ